VHTVCVILEIHLMPQRHSIDLAPDLISAFDIGQMLPLQVLRQSLPDSQIL
jgi:hypothetical protein